MSTMTDSSLAPGSTVLRVTDMKKAYGAIQAVGGVSFEVRAGEKTVLNPGVEAAMVVSQVLEYPGQDLFEIHVEGKDQPVLIPVIDAFIDRVDKGTKVLYLKAPEELYSL